MDTSVGPGSRTVTHPLAREPAAAGPVGTLLPLWLLTWGPV